MNSIANTDNKVTNVFQGVIKNKLKFDNNGKCVKAFRVSKLNIMILKNNKVLKNLIYNH